MVRYFLHKFLLRKEFIGSKKGIALLAVLAAIFIAIVLGSIIVRLMSNQSRLTHHQVSRIQAYYATMAGLNYAYDRLNSNDANWPKIGAANWPAAGYYIRNLCKQLDAECANLPGTVVDDDFPGSIRRVRIVVAASGVDAQDGGIDVPGCSPCNPPTGSNYCICTTSNYTYK